MIPKINPRRLTHRETAASLGLLNQGELQKLRAKCQREGIAFPVPGPGGFLESDLIAFKRERDAAAVHANNTQPTAPHQPTRPHDRRVLADRRRP